MPRLELCGAVTGAQLAKLLQKELRLKTDQTILWTDSTTVLTWLQSESCRFKIFVGTRVAEIQELTSLQAWHYVDSARNPADDITRGKTLKELVEPNKGLHSSVNPLMNGQSSQTSSLMTTPPRFVSQPSVASPQSHPAHKNQRRSSMTPGSSC